MPVDITKSLISSTEKVVQVDKKRRELIDAKAPGLILRVGARDSKWSWKVEIAGKTHRLELGPTSEWTIAEARTLAIQATSMVRSRVAVPDAAWLHEQRTGSGKVPASVEAKATTSFDWLQYDFKGARIVYLKEVARTLRADTHRDYKQLLEDPALDVFADRKVSTITRAQFARTVAIIHRSGRERYAEKMAGVLRTMWTHLGTDLMTHRTGVEPGIMAGLRAPTATRTERGHADPAKARKGRYVPSMQELGRILAIARSGAFDDQQSMAIQLVVFTAQRRRPVVSCWREDFTPILSGDRGLWRMPPAHRKTAAMRDDANDHVIPLPPAVWAMVEEWKNVPGTAWLFPQYRARREGMPINHMSPEVLTRALLMMPGVAATPHDVRRAFATHGERDLGWSRLASKQVLDHAGGRESNDVTAASYALHNGTHDTWPTLTKWVEYVEPFVQQAIDADPRLLDVDWLKAEIAKRRAEIMGEADEDQDDVVASGAEGQGTLVA